MAKNAVWLPGPQCAVAGCGNGVTDTSSSAHVRSPEYREILTCAGEVPRMVTAGSAGVAGKDSEDEEGDKGDECHIHGGDCLDVGFEL